VISLRDVRIDDGGATLLGPISLEVCAGARLALLGPSGSGKSTLLRAIVGLRAPTRGEVQIAGTPMNARTARVLRRRIGYVIQDSGLFPHLTAKDNATLLVRDLGLPPSVVAERLERLAALLGLSPRVLGRYPVELSGGEKQRAGILRAMMTEPDVLLMDEPLGALDVVTKRQLRRDFARLFAELDVTLVLVTHDPRDAAWLTRRG
jgi:osmoprotectant transport system ATP-binding protein